MTLKQALNGILLVMTSFVIVQTSNCLILGTKPANPFIRFSDTVDLTNYPVNVTESNIG